MAEVALEAQASLGTLVVELGYRGAGFVGYAEQPGQRSVGGELRRALETCLRRPVSMTCAGRTDAGVHALAQYVSLPAKADELTRSGRRMQSCLVALTPDDITIRGIYGAPCGFSARTDATARHYCYRIALGLSRPVMAWGHAWWLRTISELDLTAMNEAATHLLGEHDFRSFCKTTTTKHLLAGAYSTSRYLWELNVREVVEAGERLVVIDAAGNAFLHNMLRIIVGTLVEVGRGRHSPQWVADVLAARNRVAAGPTVPACGLVLCAVDYPEGILVHLS